MPPSNRPALGKGPTGKDKVKGTDRSRLMSFPSSCESSAADSPSPHSSEGSPSLLADSMPPRSMSLVEPGPSWNGPLILDDHNTRPSHEQRSPSSCSPEGPYRATPLLAPLPTKAMTSASYQGPVVSPPSQNIPPPMYSSHTPTSYSPTSERSIEHPFDSRDVAMHGPSEIREDLPRQLYNPTQPYHLQHHTLPSDNLCSDPNAPSHSQYSHQVPLYQRPTDYSHSQRLRSLTDPQGFSIGDRYPRVSELQQQHHQTRQTEYPRPHDSLHLPNTLRSPNYGPDGRLQQLV